MKRVRRGSGSLPIQWAPFSHDDDHLRDRGMELEDFNPMAAQQPPGHENPVTPEDLDSLRALPTVPFLYQDCLTCDSSTADPVAEVRISFPWAIFWFAP